MENSIEHTGLQGEQGIRGKTGETGLQGEQGIQGVPGPKGETRELWKAVYEQSIIGVAFQDLDGNFFDVNDRLCQILEYTRDEMLKLDSHDVTHPIDQEASKLMFQRVGSGEISHAEMLKRYVTKSNQVIWAKLSILPIIESRKTKYLACQIQPINGERFKLEKIDNSLLEVRPTVKLIEFIADNWKMMITIMTITLSSIIGFGVEYIRRIERTNLMETEVRAITIKLEKQNETIIQIIRDSIVEKK